MGESTNGATLAKVPPRIAVDDDAPKPKPKAKRAPKKLYRKRYNFCSRTGDSKGWFELCDAYDDWNDRNTDVQIISEMESHIFVDGQPRWLIKLVVLQPGKKKRPFFVNALGKKPSRRGRP